MNNFKKIEKESLFHRAFGRLSFNRSRSTREPVFNNGPKLERNIQNNASINNRISSDQKKTPKIKVLPKKGTTEFEMEKEELEGSIKNEPIIHSSLTSNPNCSIEAALKKFQVSTAESRQALRVVGSANKSPLLFVTKTEARQCNVADTVSKSWRQKPPPRNDYLETQWSVLSSSMLDIYRTKEDSVWMETDLAKSDLVISSSHRSLVTKIPGMKNKVEDKLTKAQSLQVLDVPGRNTESQIPSNQLMKMNQYQMRVQASMEKLNIPSWYRSSPTPRWRQSGSLSSSCTAWKTVNSDSPSPSIRSRNERDSTLLSSRNFRKRYSVVSSSTMTSSTSSITSTLSNIPGKQVYLGWRSQESLDMVPTFHKNPAQRLASSLRETSETGDNNVESIKNVTEAIIDYCNNNLCKATLDEKDNVDMDSGIPRSQDFTHDTINII